MPTSYHDLFVNPVFKNPVLHVTSSVRSEGQCLLLTVTSKQEVEGSAYFLVGSGGQCLLPVASALTNTQEVEGSACFLMLLQTKCGTRSGGQCLLLAHEVEGSAYFKSPSLSVAT